jgi:uncharacterized repeat protein (TIGR03803 family)
MLEAADGALYGCTYLGGTSGRGTIFKINKDGNGYGLLRSFGSPPDGAGPQGSLIEYHGVLYGTTVTGGSSNLGTVFRLNKDGSGYQIVRPFLGGGDGQSPRTALLVASDGLFYGTTGLGGSNGFGTIFSVAPDGNAYRVLRSFTGPSGDGSTPRGNLIEGPDGLLYGTASQGGAGAKGVLFGISKDGADYRLLWSFGGLPSDGENPVGALSLATDGTLLGCTEAGGDVGYGTVFRVDPTIVVLTLQPGAPTSLLRWPISSTFDQLEQTANLKEHPIRWTPLGRDPSTSGSYYELGLPIGPGDQFLRITRAWK